MQVDVERFTPPADATRVHDWLDGIMAELAGEMRAAARELVSTALDRWASSVTLTAAGDPALLDTFPHEWATFVLSKLGDPIGGLHTAGALSAWLNAENHDVRPPARFGDAWTSVVNEQAVAYQRTALNRIAGASDAMWNDVRDLTVQALDGGMSNEELKGLIERSTGVVEQRADAIARTETMAAYNGGHADGATALGPYGPTHKAWLAAADARTRPSHALANGQVRKVTEQFDVGGVEMDRPHDPGAPAGEVVHCRCIAQYFYPGDELPDGTTAGGELPATVTDTPATVERGVPDAGFETWAEGRRYLEQRHPDVFWDPDMAAWDRRAVRDTALFADDMAERFPEHWAQMRYFGPRSTWRQVDGINVPIEVEQWGDGAFAHANVLHASQRGTGTYIAVNPKYATNYEQWTSLVRMSRDHGWTVGQDPIDVLYHEFGHIIHGSMHRLTADAIGNVGAPYGMITGDLKAPGDLAIFPAFDQWFWGQVKKKAEGWGSKYGSTNLVEAAAETISTALKPSLVPTGAKAMGNTGQAWIEIGNLFRDGTIPDIGVGHQLEAPARYIVNVDAVLAKYGIKARPKWPMGLTVEDAKAWLATGALP